MSPLSKAHQQTILGEGLALGAVLSGLDSLTGNPTTLKLDFRAAWRAWPHASRLPVIKAGPSQDDVLHILGKSSRRSTMHVAEWHGSWPFVPVILQDWSSDELAESIHEDIPAESWRDLVRTWLTLH